MKANATVERRLNENADVHPCHDCDVPTNYAIGSYWLAPDTLWDTVVGDSTTVLCPACFHDRAKAQGISVAWTATVA